MNYDNTGRKGRGGGYEETCQKRQGSLGNATGLPKHFLKDCFQEGREGGGGGRREEGIPFLVKQKKKQNKKDPQGNYKRLTVCLFKIKDILTHLVSASV